MDILQAAKSVPLFAIEVVACLVLPILVVYDRSTEEEVPLIQGDLFGAHEDLRRVEERVEQLVALEQTTANRLVEGLRDVVLEDDESLLDFIRLLRLLESHLEEASEELERVLVHVVDQGEVRDHEVQYTTTAGHSSILLTILSDLLGGDFSFGFSLSDGYRRLLRLVEGQDQLFVFKNIVRSFRHEFQNSAFGVLELTITVGKTNDVLIFLLLEFRPLYLDDFNKQLIFETLRRHSEVEKRHLDTDLWQVVRVGKLSRHEE